MAHRVSTPLINRRPSKGAAHVVETVSFSKDEVSCICGALTSVDGFRDHRKEFGLSWAKMKGR